MSASREKRERRELREAELNSDIVKKKKKKAKVTPRMAQARKIKLRNTVLSIIAILVVLLFALLIFVNCGYMQKHATALTVGDNKITAAEFNYFYQDSYMSYLNTYYTYIYSYGFMSEPTEDEMVSYATDTALQCYTLYDAAMEAGYQLDEEAEASLEETRSTIEANAEASGYKDADEYLEESYGKGSTLDSYMSYARVQSIAYAYSTEKGESYSYTDEELRTYYNENVEDFDKITYRVFTAADKETADAMAAELDGTESSFASAAYDYADDDSKESYEDEDYTLRSNYSYSYLSEDYADWLFADGRVAGESQVFATSDDAYAVVMFISRDNNQYNTVDVRHILVQVDATGDDGESTDDDWAACKAEMDEIEALWADSDGSEDAFIALAEEYSEDTGSNTNGGLYEDVYKGEMVSSFEDWCFDEGRQVGDSGVIQSDYGYHLMYFSGYGDEYWKTLADDQKRDEDYEAWYTEFSDGYEAKSHWIGMYFTTKDLVSYAS